jgi:hypothetical protein
MHVEQFNAGAALRIKAAFCVSGAHQVKALELKGAIEKLFSSPPSLF